MNNQLYTKRRIVSTLGLVFSMSAMAVGLAVLLWILFVLFANGLAGMDANLLFSDARTRH
jgi:phosphate transport system permease protein